MAKFVDVTNVKEIINLYNFFSPIMKRLLLKCGMHLVPISVRLIPLGHSLMSVGSMLILLPTFLAYCCVHQCFSIFLPQPAVIFKTVVTPHHYLHPDYTEHKMTSKKRSFTSK